MKDPFPTLAIEFDQRTDTVVIEGVRYAATFFRDSGGFASAVGTVLRIDKREDDVITVTHLPQFESVPSGVPAKEQHHA